jgi:methionine-S-sulfoxide reductase
LGGLKGIVRTRVGYAGGKTENPTYHDLETHAEAIELDYDPTVFTFKAILDLFFASHRPVGGMRSTQYRSAIFCHDEDEVAMAERSKEKHASLWGTSLSTEIALGATFWKAEDYHQKYRLQHQPVLLKEMRRSFSNFWDMVASPTAMRLNAHVAGKLDPDILAKELSLYGLSPEVEKALR